LWPYQLSIWRKILMVSSINIVRTLSANSELLFALDCWLYYLWSVWIPKSMNNTTKVMGQRSRNTTHHTKTMHWCIFNVSPLRTMYIGHTIFTH
jgi:hypothetical protein